MALERLSYHKDFKITQAQTKVSFFYINPLLQVEFRAIFEPFSYILLNGSKRNAILSRMTSGSPVVSLEFFPEAPWEYKQLRDPGGHPEYIIRFQQTRGAILEHLGEKRKA